MKKRLNYEMRGKNGSDIKAEERVLIIKWERDQTRKHHKTILMLN